MAKKQQVNFKFNEGALIEELLNYVSATYDGHYSKSKFQSTEFIIDCGHGMGFALGNVLKYAQRYGKKEGYNRMKCYGLEKSTHKSMHTMIIGSYRSTVNTK